MNEQNIALRIIGRLQEDTGAVDDLAYPWVLVDDTIYSQAELSGMSDEDCHATFDPYTQGIWYSPSWVLWGYRQAQNNRFNHLCKPEHRGYFARHWCVPGSWAAWEKKRLPDYPFLYFWPPKHDNDWPSLVWYCCQEGPLYKGVSMLMEQRDQLPIYDGPRIRPHRRLSTDFDLAWLPSNYEEVQPVKLEPPRDLVPAG